MRILQRVVPTSCGIDSRSWAAGCCTQNCSSLSDNEKGSWPYSETPERLNVYNVPMWTFRRISSDMNHIPRLRACMGREFLSYKNQSITIILGSRHWAIFSRRKIKQSISIGRVISGSQCFSRMSILESIQKLPAGKMT